MGGNVVIIGLASVLTWAMVSRSGVEGAWCVCKSNLGQDVLQKTLDYACGAGADCNPLHTSGSCFAPNTVLAHCSYAVNSYFQRKSQAPGSCDFAGAATLTGSNPSSTSTCPYPSSGTTSTGGSGSSSSSSTTSGGSTGTVPVSSSTGTLPGSTSTTSTNPYSTTTPNSGILGGMGPTGPNMDDSAATIAAPTLLFPIIIMILLFSSYSLVGLKA